MIEKLEQCTQLISEKNFFILDDKEEKAPYIVATSGEFEIINNNKKELKFIAIDSFIYNSEDNKRCDCAIYDDGTFCFIELKNSKRTNWHNHRKKAESQLEETIKTFISSGITKNRKLEAYMCCNCKIEIKVYFQDNLNTSLYCDTQKEFK